MQDTEPISQAHETKPMKDEDTMHILSRALPRLPGLHLLSMLGAAIAVRRQRQHLLRLDAAQLRDIGLTEDQAIAESRRPVWDAAPHWRM